MHRISERYYFVYAEPESSMSKYQGCYELKGQGLAELAKSKLSLDSMSLPTSTDERELRLSRIAEAACLGRSLQR